jgi:hypothetical protein
MLGSYWTPLLCGIAAGSVLTGCTMYLLGFRRVQFGERTLLIPELDRRPFRDRWAQFRARLRQSEMTRLVVLCLVLIMASVVVMGGVQLLTFIREQRLCNAEFQNTSIELRRIGTEDRSLEFQDDELRNTRDDAMTTLVEALVTPPPPGERIDALALLNNYWNTTHAIDVRRDQLNAERAGLERQRRAQPAPKERC